MDFTYAAYCRLLELLKDRGYQFANYHNYEQMQFPVILRHDIDTSLEQAVRLGAIEAEQGIASTYFVLLRTEFYNVASARAQALLQELRGQGHELGLHFDEVAYGAEVNPITAIEKEARLLGEMLGRPVTAVSMHRTSPKTLEADYQIPGLVNSYGKTFFEDFKYLSDSRRNWREPVEEIIKSGKYPRLHILTHAFWYHEQEASLKETVGQFISAAREARYVQMKENIRDIESILLPEEV